MTTAELPLILHLICAEQHLLTNNKRKRLAKASFVGSALDCKIISPICVAPDDHRCKPELLALAPVLYYCAVFKLSP